MFGNKELIKYQIKISLRPRVLDGLHKSVYMSYDYS